MVRRREHRRRAGLETLLFVTPILGAIVGAGPVLASTQPDADFATMYVSVAVFRAAVLLAIGIVWFRIMRNARSASDAASDGWTIRTGFGFQGSRP